MCNWLLCWNAACKRPTSDLLHDKWWFWIIRNTNMCSQLYKQNISKVTHCLTFAISVRECKSTTISIFYWCRSNVLIINMLKNYQVIRAIGNSHSEIQHPQNSWRNSQEFEDFQRYCFSWMLQLHSEKFTYCHKMLSAICDAI